MNRLLVMFYVSRQKNCSPVFPKIEICPALGNRFRGMELETMAISFGTVAKSFGITVCPIMLINCPEIMIKCPEIMIIYPAKNPSVPKF